MARQRAAYGSISPTKDGITRVRYYGDLHDGKGYRRLSKNIRGNRREAQMFLAQMQVAHNDDKPTITVGDAYKQWYVPDAQKRLRASTLNNYACVYSAYIKPRWENIPVSDVRPLDVQEWLNTLSRTAATASMKILQPLMDYPTRYELIPANPMRVGYIMPKDVQERDKGVYSLEECCAIAKAIKGHTLEPAFLLSAFGSCRTGEAYGVKAEDISYETAANGMRCAVIHIQRQIDLMGRVQDSLKNKQSNRYVILPEPFATRLEQLCQEHDGYLTCDSLGMPLKRANSLRVWAKFLATNDFDVHPFQNLRPSWRTYAEWDLKIPPERLEKLMGHKGKSVTAQHYNRPEIQQLVDTVAESYKNFGTFWDIY